jgi:LPPG:FO 2-phospho-L-lactate transferase
MSGAVVVLAGGTGGAKLARGALDVVGPERLVVVANTGDDIEIYGGYVSPDVDLVTFWLADVIDERGWGLRGDTFNVMNGLRELGREVWFSLGDRDLALALTRQRELAAGARATEAQQTLLRALGVSVNVLPMSDQPVRTKVMAGGRWRSVQEYLIGARHNGGWEPVQDVAFRGAEVARTTPEVLAAVAEAETVVIGPSNPFISIGPILALDDLRAAIAGSSATVVAVSPIVSGDVLKGPTAEFMRWRDLPLVGNSIAQLYAELLDGLVSDEPAQHVPTLVTDLRMDGAGGRRRLAAEALRFAEALRVVNGDTK